MASVRGAWDPDSPLSLYELAVEYCVTHKEVFTVYDKDSQYFFLRKGISLPSQVCEDLLNAYKDSEALDDHFVHVFKDPRHTRLRRINLNDTDITEQSIEWLMTHKPVELHISGCEKLVLCGGSSSALQTISKSGSNLTALYIGDTIRHLLQDDYTTTCLESIDEEGQGDRDEQYILDCPNLRALSIHNLMDNELDSSGFIHALLRPLNRLSFLDLSGCTVSVESMDVSQLTNLTSLNLSDIYDVPQCLIRTFHVISRLTKLR